MPDANVINVFARFTTCKQCLDLRFSMAAAMRRWFIFLFKLFAVQVKCGKFKTIGSYSVWDHYTMYRTRPFITPAVDNQRSRAVAVERADDTS